MKTLFLSALLCGFVLLLSATNLAFAQYDLSPDTTQTADTVKPATPDTAGGAVGQDTTAEDSVKAEKPKLPDENNAPAEDETPPAAGDDANKGVLGQANTWLKRLLYRGHFDATEIGAYAKYQLTSWDEKVGSYGPVEARLTIYYLGTSEWMGRDAEWMQAVYQTVEGEPTTVEYDLILPSSSQIKQIHRILYRVDGGEMKTLSLALPPDQLDYDAADTPVEEGPQQIRLYSGTFDTDKFKGSGSDGAKVVIYRAKAVLPLGIVRLGYGDEGLTLTGTGSDAAPRFDVPPPPSTRAAGDDAH